MPKPCTFPLYPYNEQQFQNIPHVNLGCLSQRACRVSAPPRRLIRTVILFTALPAIVLSVGLTAGRARLILLGASAAISLIPFVNRRIRQWASAGSHFSVTSRLLYFLAVACVASSYLAFTALRQHRPLVPVIHDENSYLLQAQMLAHGRLYEPQHPLADFFESFHMLVKPVYSSIYFPGTAAFYVPGVWLHARAWVFSVMIYGLIVGLTYLIASELLGELAGLLASLLMLGVPLLRLVSVYVLSQGPATLLGLVMIWAWLRWRGRHGLSWAIVIGVCAGWAAITRPVDALAFAIPIGIALLLDLRRCPRTQVTGTVAIIVVAAAPFLVVQAHFNRAVTGSVLKTPYVLYLEQNQPGSTFGFNSASPDARPASTLPQKQAFFDSILKPMQEKRTWRGMSVVLIQRLAGVVLNSFCSHLLIPLAIIGVIVGLAVLPDRRWRTIFSIPALQFVLYLFNPYFLANYAMPMLPMAAMSVALGVRIISTYIAPERWRAVTFSFLTIATTGLALAALPEFDRTRHDEISDRFQVWRINQVLATEVKAPAVVLFRYAPPADSLQEPVYNIDVPWPDDAPIIRAHDLGARDRELIAYYAARQPWRHLYLYDRENERLYDRGTIAASRPAAFE